VPPFAGAVLAGGASRRMGVDKATIRLDGRALVARVVDALAAAGAVEVAVVGGDRDAMNALGLRPVPDRWPGAGPLGALVTALGGDGPDPVVVLACDLLAPDSDAIRRVAEALDAAPEADAAIPDVGGRRQWLHGAWRRRGGGPLESAFVAGERAIHRAVAASGLSVVSVGGIDDTAVADADTVTDLPPDSDLG
jgi:molybdopterin-guanine dinucleotide biosynthesis protein A